MSRLTPRRLAVALTIIGVLLVAGGAALIYLPAGVIALGVLLLAALFAVDDGRPTR